MSAYEHCRWEIEAAGATYVAAEQAVRDGRIVTGQTWRHTRSSIAWCSNA